MLVQGQTAAPATTPNTAPSAPPVTKPKHETEFKMKHGSYLGFGQVYLGMGEIGFRVEVTNEQKQESVLEFRIDKPKGKIIGTLKIPYTGDTTYALKVPPNLGRHYGTHDLYLVAKGSGQFIISSFSFIHVY
ncbi:MAG TPA: carbohydrate-binding protein [Chitinophaga sp.]|uniref:carbohydrate-binding protein n=1 Tax=Chitinophaga sp. TaxID=1869181 RepID=UPI002DBCABB8|nr:carbohydrate-binding protein [Chitinophaga sp.]HEU4553487.1 carbohydrate-binding protein [Chitinophaga sp.]